MRAYFAELGRTGWQQWNRFWFTPADPATLGLVRLLAGLILFYTHFVWTVDLLGFLGPAGRIPVDVAQRLQRSELAWSHLYWLSSSASGLWVAHVLALIILLMFVLGLCTRVTSVLSALIAISYAHRATGALFGLDQVNGFLALYLAIGPAGAAYSLDAWRARRRGAVAAGAAAPQVMANVALRLIQVHLCVVYLFAGLGKLLGQSWWAGTALWGAFANFEYQTLDMTWLVSYPLLVNLATQTILVWEITYIVLVWPRLLRPLVLALAIPLHLGIGLAMGMMTFGLAMLVANLAFVPPQLVRAVLDPWLGSAPGGAGQGARAATRAG